MIDYKVEYKKRKTVSLRLDSDGSLLVIAPIEMTQKEIEDLIISKKHWILKKQKILSDRKKLEPNKILYLGKEYNVKVIKGIGLKKNFITLYDDTFFVNVSSLDKVDLEIKKWFKEQTLKMVNEYVDKYSCYFKCKPKSIKIKEQKTRWGSCSYDNNLNFNWRLSMAKKEALEYVVVHEICHMVCKNHSSDFWNLVKKLMNNYEENSKYLDDNGYLFFEYKLVF